MKTILRQFKGREHTPFIQFVKYGIGGAFATLVHMALFYLLALKMLPALSPNDVIAHLLRLSPDPVSDGLRARNYMFDYTVAFLFSNLVAYVINIYWVFHRGRHHWVLEIAYFYGVSGISALVGTLLTGYLIHSFGVSTTFAFGVNVVISLLINFVVRKFFVFKG
jgi:putative flippase GtrA